MKPKILTTLPDYTRALFFGDLLAGVTVAMVALPLSLAIAIASGARPETGLVTAIVAGFLVSLLGGSRIQIGGPTGAFIVVVYSIISEHGHDGLVLATFMAGIILLIAAILRAGSLIRYVPEPVVAGFTAGIGIIIAFSQLKDFLGLEIAALPAEFLPKLHALWIGRETFNVVATAVALVTMALIVALRRTFPRFPGMLLALAATSGLVYLADLPVETIRSRFGALPTMLPVPGLPEITAARLIELLPSAIIIAFLAGIESLLSALVADRMIGGSYRPNAEVLAQGAANIGSALFGGLPATGAIARTATNARAGGKTPVAGMVHAIAIFLIMVLAGGAAGYLAMPALAALLVLTAWNMSEPAKWPEYLSRRKSDGLLFLMTLLLTVLADLTIAIGVGVALGLALRMRRRGVPAESLTPPDR